MLTAAQKDLLHLLKQHPAADAEEARHLKYGVTFAELEPVWFDPRTLPAHFTGSAVVWDRTQRRVLLAWDPALPAWVLPGSHDDGRRDLAGAAQRDVERRSGLRLAPMKPLQVFDLGLVHVPATAGQRAHQHLDLRFLFLAEGAPVPGPLRWFTLDEAAQLLDEEGAGRVLARLQGPGGRAPRGAS